MMSFLSELTPTVSNSFNFSFSFSKQAKSQRLNALQ